MTTFQHSAPFAEGEARERSLFAERAEWTREQWVERKAFLEQQIKEEDELVERARLYGRLTAVNLEGATKYGG